MTVSNLFKGQFVGDLINLGARADHEDIVGQLDQIQYVVICDAGLISQLIGERDNTAAADL